MKASEGTATRDVVQQCENAIASINLRIKHLEDRVERKTAGSEDRRMLETFRLQLISTDHLKKSITGVV